MDCPLDISSYQDGLVGYHKNICANSRSFEVTEGQKEIKKITDFSS